MLCFFLFVNEPTPLRITFLPLLYGGGSITLGSQCELWEVVEGLLATL